MMKMMITMICSTLLSWKNHMMTILMVILVCSSSSYFMFLISNNYWFSMVIILIYISGIMVLFMFIVSLSPTEKIYYKMKSKTLLITLLVLLIAEKNLMTLESFKINSCLKWNFYPMTIMILLILMMAYLPPKTMESFYKGMKTSK